MVVDGDLAATVRWVVCRALIDKYRREIQVNRPERGTDCDQHAKQLRRYESLLVERLQDEDHDQVHDSNVITTPNVLGGHCNKPVESVNSRRTWSSVN